MCRKLVIPLDSRILTIFLYIAAPGTRISGHVMTGGRACAHLEKTKLITGMSDSLTTYLNRHGSKGMLTNALPKQGTITLITGMSDSLTTYLNRHGSKGMLTNALPKQGTITFLFAEQIDPEV